MNTLKDYSLIVLEKKWIVISIIILSVLVSFLLTSLQEDKYIIRTSLRVERNKIVEEIKRNIESGYYLTEKEVRTDNPLTDLLVLEIESFQKEESKEVLKDLKEVLIKDYEEKVNQKKEEIESDLERMENLLDFLKYDKPYGEDSILTLQLKILEKEKELPQLISPEIVEEINYVRRDREKALSIVLSAVLGFFVGVLFVLSKELIKK